MNTQLYNPFLWFVRSRLLNWSMVRVNLFRIYDRQAVLGLKSETNYEQINRSEKTSLYFIFVKYLRLIAKASFFQLFGAQISTIIQVSSARL